MRESLTVTNFSVVDSFRGAVDAAASGPDSLGLRRGERVVVWLPERSQEVIALHSSLRAGGSLRRSTRS